VCGSPDLTGASKVKIEYRKWATAQRSFGLYDADVPASWNVYDDVGRLRAVVRGYAPRNTGRRSFVVTVLDITAVAGRAQRFERLKDAKAYVARALAPAAGASN
jgi:hypothetical protein